MSVGRALRGVNRGGETFENEASELGKSFIFWGLVVHQALSSGRFPSF